MAKTKSNNAYAEAWRRLRKNKVAMVSLAVIALLILMTVFADLIVPYSAAITNDASLQLAAPSAEHWFGCDHLGRDLFARVIHGSRISLLLGFGTTLIITVIAVILGTTAAYFGGKFDSLLMRAFDILISIPSVLLALAISAGFGNGVIQLIVAITIGQLASFTRVIRSAVLNLVDQEYIEAERALGLNHARIIMTHIIPNAMGTILVQATMQVARNILMGALLSFLGLGAPIPTPEWGQIASDGISYLRYTGHIVVFPTIFITITALAINLFGDGLRDALDPRLKGKA